MFGISPLESEVRVGQLSLVAVHQYARVAVVQDLVIGHFSDTQFPSL